MKQLLSLLIWLSLCSVLEGQVVPAHIPESFSGRRAYALLSNEERIDLSSSVYYLNDSQNTYDLQNILQPHAQSLFQRMENTPELLPQGTHWFRLALVGNHKPLQAYILEYPKHYSRLEVYQIEGDTFHLFDRVGYDVESDSNHFRVGRFDARIVLGPGERKVFLFRGILPHRPKVAGHFSFVLFPLRHKLQFNRWRTILITTIRVLALTVLFYHLLLYFRLERNRVYYLYFVILAIPPITHSQLDIGVFHYIEEWLWESDLAAVGPWGGIEFVIFHAFNLLGVRGLLDLPEFLPRMNKIFLLLILLILLDPFMQMSLGSTWSLPFFDVHQPYRNLLFLMTISAMVIASGLRWRQGSRVGFWIFLGLSIMSFNTIFQGFIFGEGHPVPALVFSFFTLLALLTSASLAVSERHRELEIEHSEHLINRRLALAETKRLQELDEVKSRLYTNLTHEFRTPLTVILGLADQIKGYDKERSLIRRNGQNLLRLINQMLEMSRIESGKASLEMQQSDILPFLHYVTDSFHSLALSKRVSLSFFSPEERIVMDYDREKVRQVLSNLIANAIKFTPEYGEVQVAAQKAGHNLRLSVKDTGIGISSEDLPGIFDRFRQADDISISGGEGTGIGLALAKELLKLMEGDIEVKSQLKKGSEFVVYLPVRNEGPWEEWKESAPETKHREEVATATAPPVAAPLLLLIEDNQDVVYYLQSLLQDAYRVIIAQNGAEGVELAVETVPDIIISDVMMPEKDGFEVCRELKQDEHTSHIPIILLTAKGDRASKKEGLQTGADAYLAKPFDREELFIRLQKLIEVRQKLKEKYQHVSLIDMPGTAIENDPELQFLQKLEGVLRENLGNEDFRIYPHLCRAMLMSRPQLYRKLKALKGISPSEYLRLYRLREARRLLLQTDEKIGDIAFRVGFRDASYFTKAYAAEFGETPTETRNKQ